MKRRETPLKRINPSGKARWVARYTDQEGRRRSAGTFDREGPCKVSEPGREPECCAQHAIDAAYQREAPQGGGPVISGSLADYAEVWPKRHPKPTRTAKSHKTRLRALLAIPVYGRPLGEYPYRELRRHHMNEAIDHMLSVEGRAQKGAIGIRNTASTMTEDAITDQVAEVNFAKGAQIKANDPRIQKAPKKIAIWTFDQMREFASAGRPEVRRATRRPEDQCRAGEPRYYSAVDYEPMLATICLANFRVGEVFALLRAEMDLEAAFFYPTGTAFEGEITRGDSTTKKHEGEPNPIAPSLATILRGMALRIDTQLLFPTPEGEVWRDSNFRRDVWEGAQIASGLDMLPHECRHSYVTHLRAEGVDPADLAAVTRHDIDTATRHYTKPLGRSMDQIRKVIG